MESPGRDTDDGPSDPLLAKLDQLEDLFRRRLLDDKDKRRAFEELYQRLEHAEAAVAIHPALPLIRDVIAVLDRLGSYDGPDPALADSIADELLEALRRQGVEQSTDERDLLPPQGQVHDAIPDNAVAVTTVLDVHRPAYRVLSQTIRPALVSVAVPIAEHEPSAPSPTHAAHTRSEPLSGVNQESDGERHPAEAPDGR